MFHTQETHSPKLTADDEATFEDMRQTICRQLEKSEDAFICSDRSESILLPARASQKQADKVIQRIIETPLDGIKEESAHPNYMELYNNTYPNGAYRTALALINNKYVEPGPWIVHLAHVLDVIIVTCNAELKMQEFWYSKDQVKPNVSDMKYIVLAVDEQTYTRVVTSQ